MRFDFVSGGLFVNNIKMLMIFKAHTFEKNLSIQRLRTSLQILKKHINFIGNGRVLNINTV